MWYRYVRTYAYACHERTRAAYAEGIHPIGFTRKQFDLPDNDKGIQISAAPKIMIKSNFPSKLPSALTTPEYYVVRTWYTIYVPI